MKVFWLWQSDTPAQRFLIRDALKAAIEKLKEAPDIEDADREQAREALHLDHDRQGVSGSPNLADEILKKIADSTVVVADVTLVGKITRPRKAKEQPQTRSAAKKLINSNVAIELGYALRALSTNNVVMVFNSHYGKYEELPFDLRHKGGAIMFTLPPDADKEFKQKVQTVLTARFVDELRPFLAAKAAQVTASPFEETPTTFNRAAYFARDEGIAEIGEGGDHQVFHYERDAFAFIRLIPVEKLSRPVPLALLREAAGAVPLLSRQWGSNLSSVNAYGAIGYAPFHQTSRLLSSTQLFENGEVWAIGKDIIRTERGELPPRIKLPFTASFVLETVFYRALHAVTKFAQDTLALKLPLQIELGISGVNGLTLGVGQDSMWGPIRKPEITCRRRVNSPNGLNDLLLDFFCDVYDKTGHPRPAGRFGFPPNAPVLRPEDTL